MDSENQYGKKSEAAIVDAVVDLGSSVGSALAGAAIGTAVAGPVGTALGAVTGTAIESAFRTLGKEIKERVLSKKEDQRVGTVFSLAAEKIRDNLYNGKALREDDFFSSNDGASPADEVLEATIIAAQREYEEKKLPYMANLYANIAFDKSISRETANYLIKCASDLTYRQLVILMMIGYYQTGSISGFPLKTVPYYSLESQRVIEVSTETFDLYRKSLIFSSVSIRDAAGINPSKLLLGGYGAFLFSLMELAKINLDDILVGEVIAYLGGL